MYWAGVLDWCIECSGQVCCMYMTDVFIRILKCISPENMSGREMFSSEEMWV